MKNLSIFTFQNYPVRIHLENQEPYFCLSDVCSLLNINRKSTEAFNLNSKGCIVSATLTKGGKQNITFINEPNLYRVIFRSNKKEAVAFQNWVFEEVLPQIRKKGAYNVYIDESQKAQVLEAVNCRVRLTGESHQSIYRLIHNAFEVNSYHKIKQSDFAKVMDFIKSGDFILPQKKQPQLTQVDQLCTPFKDGRYLVVVKGNDREIKDISHCVIVDPIQYDIVRGNMKLLANQIYAIEGYLTDGDLLTTKAQSF